MDFYNNLLSDISNFAIVVFGLCVSLYTLIYSFIMNKKEQLIEIVELKKAGETVKSFTYKETIYRNSIIRMKILNNYIITCLLISLPIYIFSLIVKYFKLFNYCIVIFEKEYCGVAIDSLILSSILLLIAIIGLISQTLKVYLKDSKI